MKTAKPLLLRDALARLFVEAAMGTTDAREHVRTLARFGPDSPQPALATLRAEDGAPLFQQGGALDPAFEALAPYVLDRARRFAAALHWIEEDRTTGVPLEVARAAWDAGLFFEVHEVLEPIWLESEGTHKLHLQGLIMAAVGVHHLIEGNLTGAGSLLGKAADRLGRRDPEEARDAAAAEHDVLDDGKRAAFAQRIATLGEEIRSGHLTRPEQIEELPRF